MGIQNKEGALYFATGVDNTGLYSGKREAIGIIKAMAGEITSFDVFGGLGISAGIAFAQAAKSAYDFEKQFQQSMKEVATLSSGIKGNLTNFMNQVVDVTREVPVLANDAAKALYQIVSAGHDGADAMNILKVSAKAAIGGVTDTATAADAVTTILNAYKMNASEAGKISDQLFTTVKLGKTSFGELGKSIAQAAPVAAAYGVEIDQVLAAVATLTKQGTPTAQAMTQIRAAIVGVSKYLGDGAYNGRTFQEALELVRQKAAGSESKLREMIPEMEAVNGLLGLTGQNAQEAAGHLDEVGNSAGAAEAAFQEMASSAQNQVQLLQNNIVAALRPMGKAILKEVSDIASSFNEAFKNGDVERSMKTLGDIVVILTGAFVGYKGSIIATTAAKAAYHTITTWITKQKSIEAANLVLTKGLYAAEATMIAKNTGMHVLLTNALKAQITTSLKATAALLTNPYVLAAAAVATLGYSIYKYATRVTQAEEIQRKYNESLAEAQKKADDEKKHLEDLIAILDDESSSNTKRLDAMNEIKENYPSLFQKYIDEKGHVKDLIGLWKEYNEIKGAEATQQHKDDLQNINALIDKKRNEKKNLTQDENYGYRSGLIDDQLEGLYKIRRQAEKKVEKDNLLQWQQDLKGRTDQQIQWELEEAKRLQETLDKHPSLKKQGVRITQGTNKASIDEEQLKHRISVLTGEQSARSNSVIAGTSKGNEDMSSLTKKIREAEASVASLRKQSQAGLIDTKKVDDAVTGLETLKKQYKTMTGNDYGSTSLLNSVSEQQEKIKQLMNANSLENQRQSEDLENKLTQSKIDVMAKGFKKEQAQRELNNKIEIQNVKRQKEDYILAYIQSQKELFDAQEELRAKENKNYKKKTFDSSSVTVDSSAYDGMIENITQRQANDEKAYNNELLSVYQDYTDQRLAIEKKFNDDIALLEEQRKVAEKSGDTKQVEKIDRAKTQATKEKGKALMGADYEQLKKSPEYIRAFENLKKTSSETLSSLLSQLENAKQVAAEVLSPDELREYTSTIQDVMDELDSRNPFKALADKKKKLAEAEEELARAKKNLEAVQSGEKVVKSISYNKDTDKIEKTYWSTAEALKEYNKAKDKSVGLDAEVHEAERKVDDVMGELFDSIKNLGSAIGGEAGEIIGVIGDIGQFALMAMHGVESASETASTAIQTVEKASVILAIISAAIQIATKIASLFNSTDYMAEFRKEMEKLNHELELAKLNAEISADENNIFGDDLWKNAIKNVELANEAFLKYNNTLDLISNRKKNTGFMGLVSEIKGIKNSYDSLGQSIADMQIKVQHKTLFRSAKYKSLKDAVPELFNADGSVNQAALEKFIGSDTFKKLSEENQRYLQEMSDYWTAYQEAVEQVKDYLTDIFGDLGNTMSDALVDAFTNGTDAAKVFTDSVSEMLEKLAKQMVYSVTLGTLMENAQNEMLDIMKDTSLSEEEKFKKMAGVLDGFVDKAVDEQDRANQLLEVLKQSAADKGFDIFTSESADSAKENLDSFVSSMQSAFTSLEVTAKDVSDNIYDYFRQAMINALYEKEYKGKMEALYKTFEDLSADGLSESDMAQLGSQVDQYIEQMMKGVEDINNLFSDKLKDNEDLQSFVDSVKSAMSSIEATAEDVTDNIFEYIRQQMVEKMFADTFQPQIEEFYKRVQEAMSDGSITDAEKDALRSEAEKLANDIVAAKDILSDTLGITGNNLKKELEEEFKSFSDGVLNSLYDAEVTATAVSKNIADSMRKELIEAMYIEQYEPRIKAIWEKWKEYSADGLVTDEERANIKNDIDELSKEAADAAKEISDAWKDTGEEVAKAFDSFSDSIKSVLYNAEATAEDVANNIYEYMRKALVDSMFVEQVQPQIKAWYDKYTEFMADGAIDSVERGVLDEMLKEIQDAGVEIVDAANKLFPSLDTGAQKRAEEAAQEAENAKNAAEQEWESFSDDILNSLYDIEATAEDISDNMGEYMRKALIKAMYVNNFKPQMQKWYDEWQKAMGDDDLSSEEKQTLDAMKQSMIDDMKKEVDAINQFFGTMYFQEASSKGFETISQDTGDEISGRLTGVYESSERIRIESAITNDWLATIYSVMESQGIRQNEPFFMPTNVTTSVQEQTVIGMQGDMLKRLEDIYKFNAEFYDEYSDMMLSVIDHLDSIHKNTNSLPRIEMMLKEIKQYSKALAGK